MKPRQTNVDGREEKQECTFKTAGQMGHHGHADQNEGSFARARERPVETLRIIRDI